MDRQLLDYLPEILQTYAEFRELARVEQPAVAELWDAIDDLFNEAFITDEECFRCFPVGEDIGDYTV